MPTTGLERIATSTASTRSIPELDLEPGAGRERLEEAIDGHVLGEASLMGTYERVRDRPTSRRAGSA